MARGELGSTWARLAAAHAEALVASDAARLEAVSGELEDAGMVLEAVDAAAQASAVARETGRLGTATTAERRARELAARCDARTPALEDVGVAVALSSREREVVTLAADGLTNREIATRLHLSVRTVESHVYRACTRLGVPDRATLVAVTVPSSSR